MFNLHASVKTYCHKTNPFWIILWVTFILIWIEVIYYFIFLFFRLPHESNFPLVLPTTTLKVVLYMLYRFLKACILAPILETFLFQYLLFEILISKLSLNKILFIFLSAIIFGLSHYPYYSAMLVTFTICIVINYFYVVLTESRNKKSAYFIIVLVHSFLNAAVYINQFFDRN